MGTPGRDPDQVFVHMVQEYERFTEKKNKTTVDKVDHSILTSVSNVTFSMHRYQTGTIIQAMAHQIV